MPVDDFKYPSRDIAASRAFEPLHRPAIVPFTPLRGPLAEARIALVTTAGIWNRDTDVPFHDEHGQRGPLQGDPTYRVIPADIRQEQIGAMHRHVINTDLLRDVNVALPVARLRELVAAGEIGAIAGEHYSFMGFQGDGPSGPDTSAWEETYGPEVARRMVDRDVNGVVLTPTSPDCCRNAPVLARVFERYGLSTVMVTMRPHDAQQAGIPRAAGVAFPFGHPMGAANDAAVQRAVLCDALRLLAAATGPNTIVHLPYVWPKPRAAAHRA